MPGINKGQQNNPKQGRSILDYSIVTCFTLFILLVIVCLDAFEYITVPRLKLPSKAEGAPMDNTELLEVEREMEEATKLVEEKTAEVTKLVEKVEDDIIKDAPEPVTAAEKQAEEEKKAAVVKAVVENELDISNFCGGCMYKQMPFTCQRRVEWMMDAYGITEDAAKESVIHRCHNRLRRGRV
mmetsp:Transcript_19988/g.42065  ORF Transcript_19988/g.42065 Transcript_19988/m.42065 type:complete len:183 (+) Transcript_19988:100-648(+)